MVDAGHGGDEDGAIGPGGTKEKDITLAVAKIVAAKLANREGIKVVMTRSSDRKVMLDERKKLSDKARADLFVSIHLNAATKAVRRGFETYYLDNATDKASLRLAEIENRSSGRSQGDLEQILLAMMQNVYAADSESLAKDIQKSMIARLSRTYKDIADNGVKSALFYVLVGVKCPSVLVEASYISNPAEEKRSRNADYQNALAGAIVNGINSYLKSANSGKSDI